MADNVAMAPQGTLVPLAKMPRGLPKLISETRPLYTRQIKRLARTPTIVVFSLIQPLIWLVLERVVSVNTAAAGGNASLMTLQPA